jgi:uncharacterized lipoprotein NlpE involved in copper resistance
MKKSIVSGCVVALLLMGLVGCEKKSGEAVVIGKDYVAGVKEGEGERRARDQSRTMDCESADARQRP